MESQLLRMQWQESLGRLASGIAHDLNNVLAPVMMAGDLLQTAPLNENGRECVEMIRASAARGADMVKQLLLYSRGADGRRSNLEPARVVREVVRMVKETFPKDIEVRLTLADAPWLVEADRTQIHQVVLNLCVNARDAMPTGGVLTLGTECIEIDTPVPSRYPQARPGRYVVLMVSDTGTGIPHEFVDKIFDPFFTTKPQGQGTGLGLSTVQGIVAGHGGFVDVQTEPRRGSTFRVYLPSTGTAGEAADEDPGGASGVPRGSGQTILLVDDEVMVRNLVQRSLETAGYVVVTADGAEQALAIYKRLGSRIGLVLMDLWMPHVNGFTAIQRLAKMDRQVRVIAISGLAEARDEALRLGPVVRHFLVKPWRTRELLQIVSEVLASPQE
jgi:CheY-like chemotaxis protein